MRMWSRPFRGTNKVQGIRPAYFYQLGFFVNAVRHLRDDVPSDLRVIITSWASQQLSGFITDEVAKQLLPKAIAKAGPLAVELALWASSNYTGRTCVDWVDLRRMVESFSTTLTDELDGLYCYALTAKGNLAVPRLAEGASDGYPQDVRKHFNRGILNEIDDAGLCLACAMYTACGFHILRAVEMSVKGLAFIKNNNQLPKINQRSWGKYIELLEGKVSATVVDEIRILKGKRNPLMHPQHVLDEGQAINLFCVCGSVLESITQEVTRQKLESDFMAAFGLIAVIENAESVA